MENWNRFFRPLAVSMVFCSWPLVASADVITFGGDITQATQDGTGPAVNNPALNAISDVSEYTVTLDFSGAITSPGIYHFVNSMDATLVFFDADASATEDSFDAISFVIGSDGSYDDISLLGCLTTGSGCFMGNQLALNFEVPSVSLDAQHIAATGILNQQPLELLEDDGLTDIQGSALSYSYFPAVSSSVPEPASLILGATIAVLMIGRERILRSKSNRRKTI